MIYLLHKYINNFKWISLCIFSVFLTLRTAHGTTLPSEIRKSPCLLNRVIALKKQNASLDVKLGVAWPILLDGSSLWITPHHVINEAESLLIIDCHNVIHHVTLNRSDLNRDLALLKTTRKFTRDPQENVLIANTKSSIFTLNKTLRTKNIYLYPYSAISWSEIPINSKSLVSKNAARELGRPFEEELLIYTSAAAFPTASGSLIHSTDNKTGMLLRSEFFATQSLFLPLTEISLFLADKKKAVDFNFISEDTILLKEDIHTRITLSNPCLTSTHASQWIKNGGGSWGNGGGGSWGNGGGGVSSVLSADLPEMKRIAERQLRDAAYLKLSSEEEEYLDLLVHGYAQDSYFSADLKGYYFSLPSCDHQTLVWKKWDKTKNIILETKEIPFLQDSNKLVPLSFDLLNNQDLMLLSQSDLSLNKDSIPLSGVRSIPLFNTITDSSKYLINHFCSLTNAKSFSQTQTDRSSVSSLPFLMGLDFFNTIPFENFSFKEDMLTSQETRIECRDNALEININLDLIRNLYFRVSADKDGVLKIKDKTNSLSSDFTLRPIRSWAQSESSLVSSASSRPAKTSLYYELGLLQDKASSPYFELDLPNLRIGNEYPRPTRIILKP